MVLLHVKWQTLVIFKKCLRVGGLWPPDSHKRGSMLLFLVSILVQIMLVITRLVDPLEKCPPYSPGGLAAGTIAGRLNGILLQLILRVYGSRMIPLIESTIHDWVSVADPKERNIMKRHDKLGSFYFFIQLSVFCGFVNVRRIMDSPFFKNVEALKDKRIICAFSDDSLWIYMMPVFNIALSIFLNLILKGSDILIWSFAMHLSAQFKILKMQFQEFLSIENEKESRKEFRRLVERHKQLLNLTTSFERAFRVYVAWSVFDEQFTICLYAFRLGDTIATGRFHAAAWLLFAIVIALSCIYMYYYASEYLTGCCEEIGYVLTYCEWYTLSKESRTNFSIVIARCQRTTIFTVAKLYKLNLPNFLYVVQTLYSFVSYIVACTSHKK